MAEFISAKWFRVSLESRGLKSNIFRSIYIFLFIDRSNFFTLVWSGSLIQRDWAQSPSPSPSSPTIPAILFTGYSTKMSFVSIRCNPYLAPRDCCIRCKNNTSVGRPLYNYFVRQPFIINCFARQLLWTEHLFFNSCTCIDATIISIKEDPPQIVWNLCRANLTLCMSAVTRRISRSM